MEELAEKLAAHLPDEFSRKMFAATMAAARDPVSPLRLSFFSLGIREMMGHLLHSLAPDGEIQSCSWFVKEYDRPTRRQRAKYAVQGGFSDASLKVLGLDPSSLYRQLAPMIEGLNKHVHVREDTLVDPSEAAPQIEATLRYLSELFEAIEGCRQRVASAVEEAIHNDTVMELVTTDTDYLNVLSSSHSVESVSIERIKAIRIDAEFVYFNVTGTVDVEFYWGRGEDGAASDENFPFGATMQASVDDLEDFSEVEVGIDASEWHARFECDEEPDDYPDNL
jgi:hypothetical protein